MSVFYEVMMWWEKRAERLHGVHCDQLDLNSTLTLIKTERDTKQNRQICVFNLFL